MNFLPNTSICGRRVLRANHLLTSLLPARKLQMRADIEKYAVAVRDGFSLFLFLWVKRSKAGDFYLILHRPHDPKINAHASYHADGQFHVKTHDMSGRNKFMYLQKQKPDQNFVGTENLQEQTITLANVRSIGDDCDPNNFSEVFEIDASQLETKTFIRVTADLVSNNYGPNLVPNARIVKQSKFRHSSPFLVLTLYEMPHEG